MDFLVWFTSSKLVFLLSLLCCVAATGIVGALLYKDVKNHGWWE